MAISPKICIQYEADGSQITIKDDTGVYDADNTGGYGTPNNDRSDYAAVLRVFYQPYSGAKQSLLELDNSIKYDANYTNSEVSTYIIPYKTDGWYQFHYVLVPTTLASPVVGDIIYDTNVADLRQYDAGLNLVEVYDESELLDPNTYELVTVEEMRAVKLKILLSQYSQDYFACKGCTECNCEDEFWKAIKLRQDIGTTVTQFNIAKYDSQQMMEKLIKQYNIK